MAGRMKFNLKDFRDKLNVEPAAKTTPGFSDVAIAKIGVKKMAFRGNCCLQRWQPIFNSFNAETLTQ